MTLFCYGAIEIKSDKEIVTECLSQLTDTLRWKLDFTSLQPKFSLMQLFGLPVSAEENFLVYEVLPNCERNQDTYDQLYADFGAKMLEYYRDIGRHLNVINWENLEFGTSEEVNQVYQATPADIPIIRFARTLFNQFPERQSILCLDQNFERATACQKVTGDTTTLLREIWLTIAFGFSWPNLCLLHH